MKAKYAKRCKAGKFETVHRSDLTAYTLCEAAEWCDVHGSVNLLNSHGKVVIGRIHSVSAASVYVLSVRLMVGGRLHDMVWHIAGLASHTLAILNDMGWRGLYSATDIERLERVIAPGF